MTGAPAEEESAQWFNYLMLAAWPNVSNRVAVEAKRFMVWLWFPNCAFFLTRVYV